MQRKYLKKIALIITTCALVLLTLVLGGCPPLQEGEPPEEALTCPLTGEELDSEPDRPPFAVAIDNIAQARPQSGLDRADIVYEVLAEGGIPRLLAIYACGSADRIGPVRSARPYFISLARQFNAVLVHAGGSVEALQQIDRGDIRSLNQFEFPGAYERDPSRSAPHNLFTSTPGLVEAAEDAGFEGPDISSLDGPSFGEGDVEGEDANTVRVPLPTVTVTYRHDRESGEYLRSMNGQPHRDAVTGEQLSAKNVVVQFAEHTPINGTSRLNIDLVGSGRALFFIEGKRIEGRWSRSSESESFRYEGPDGSEFRFRPGQTWVEIVRPGTNIGSTP